MRTQDIYGVEDYQIITEQGGYRKGAQYEGWKTWPTPSLWALPRVQALRVFIMVCMLYTFGTLPIIAYIAWNMHSF